MARSNEEKRDGAGRGAQRESAGGMGGRGFGRRKVCKFCAEKALQVEYKEAGMLKSFITERGKIIPRRINGNCARHQRMVALAIKRARSVALLPFTILHA